MRSECSNVLRCQLWSLGVRVLLKECSHVVISLGCSYTGYDQAYDSTYTGYDQAYDQAYEHHLDVQILGPQNASNPDTTTSHSRPESTQQQGKKVPSSYDAKNNASKHSCFPTEDIPVPISHPQNHGNPMHVNGLINLPTFLGPSIEREP